MKKKIGLPPNLENFDFESLLPIVDNPNKENFTYIRDLRANIPYIAFYKNYSCIYD